MNNTHELEYGLDDFIQPQTMVADGVVQLVGGSGFLAGWRYDGPAYTPEAAVELRDRLAARLDYGKNWVFETNIIRLPSTNYPAWGVFPDAVSQMIEQERIRNYTQPGRYYETHHYMTLTYLPPSRAQERAKGWLYSGNGNGSGLASKALDHFQAKVAEWENMLGASLEMHRLKSHDGFNDLLRYIQLCITGEDRLFLEPDPDTDLRYLLGGIDLANGNKPRLVGMGEDPKDGRPVRVLALDPLPQVIAPAMLERLEVQPMCFRLHGRAILMDRAQAGKVLEGKRADHESKKVGWWDQLKRTANPRINTRAAGLEQQVSVAKDMSENQNESWAHYSANVVLIRDTEEEMSEAIAAVQVAAENCHLKTRVETINVNDALCGSWPAHWFFNLRKVPVRAFNVAGMTPLHSVSAGDRFCPNPKMPRQSSPLMVATGVGMNIYRHNLHVEDVGHTVVYGPTGAGKTVLLGLTAVQALRWPGTEIVMFDRMRTQKVLCAALGGKYYDFGAHSDINLCPLQTLETPGDLGWAGKYIETLCKMNGLAVNAEHTDRIGVALDRFSRGKHRSLTHFAGTVGDKEIQAALQLYTCGNPVSASLLDGETDAIQDSRFTVFELAELMEMDSRIYMAVQMHLFRRIQRKLNPAHVTGVFLDESRRMIRDNLFAEFLENSLKEFRNLNCFVVLALQEIEDSTQSKLCSVVDQQTKTKIFLPNAAVKGEHTRKSYTELHCSADEIAQIAAGQPKSEYFVKTPNAFTRIRFDIQPVTLAFCASTSEPDRELVDRLMKANPKTWQADFLRARGLQEWADCYEQMTENWEVVCA